MIFNLAGHDYINKLLYQDLLINITNKYIHSKLFVDENVYVNKFFLGSTMRRPAEVSRPRPKCLLDNSVLANIPVYHLLLCTQKPSHLGLPMLSIKYNFMQYMLWTIWYDSPSISSLLSITLTVSDDLQMCLLSNLYHTYNIIVRHSL